MKTHTKELEHAFDEQLDHIRHHSRPVKPILGGFLVGSVIGVATALLFAPRSGQETRAEIRDRAMDIRDRTTETVKDTVSQAKSKAYELKDTVVEKAEGLKQRGRHTMNRTVDDVTEAVETGTQRMQNQ